MQPRGRHQEVLPYRQAHAAAAAGWGELTGLAARQHIHQRGLHAPVHTTI